VVGALALGLTSLGLTGQARARGRSSCSRAPGATATCAGRVEYRETCDRSVSRRRSRVQPPMIPLRRSRCRGRLARIARAGPRRANGRRQDGATGNGAPRRRASGAPIRGADRWEVCDRRPYGSPPIGGTRNAREGDEHRLFGRSTRFRRASRAWKSQAPGSS
jgi:hypothetical protein